MAGINPIVLIITLNVERSECPDRKEEVIRMEQKAKTHSILTTRIHFRFKDRTRLKIKDGNNIPGKE